MEEIQFVKNHNNFDVNISFLENCVKKDSQSITNGEFNVSGNNCSNTNDAFLMLVKDDVVINNTHTNALRLPNKRVKNFSAVLVTKNFNQVLTVI